MNKYEELVLECHKAMEMSIDEQYSINLLKLRQKLINEIETQGSVTKETKLKMFKELADLQYVLSGMVVSFGIPMEEVFQRVHNSNMSKLVDGKPLKREDGKFLKGPNYKKPDLSDLG